MGNGVRKMEKEVTGLGDGTVGKLPVLQTGRPEFIPQHLGKTPGMVTLA